MQKTDLIAKIAKDTGVTQVDAGKVVNAMIDSVVEALKGGDKVTLTGFGTFEVRTTAARKGTNPSTGAKIDIPAGKRAAFSAGAVLKSAVSGKKPAPSKSAAKPAKSEKTEKTPAKKTTKKSGSK